MKLQEQQVVHTPPKDHKVQCHRACKYSMAVSRDLLALSRPLIDDDRFWVINQGRGTIFCLNWAIESLSNFDLLFKV